MRPNNNLSGRIMITAALLFPVSLFAVSTYADDQFVQSAPETLAPPLPARHVTVHPAPGRAAIDFVLPASFR
jgi:hypothetical protein